MAMYLVITAATPFPEDGLALLQEKFPDNHKVVENAWVVRSTLTTSSEVARSIFPPSKEGRGPRALVVRFDGYGGYHEPSLWEWLRNTPEE